MKNTVETNLLLLRERIEKAALRVGRKAGEIRLMGASKTQPVDKIREAYAAGLTLFGENRVFEGAEKFRELPEDIELHLIGHLQRNKAKTAAEAYSCIQSIDKKSTVEAVCKYLSPESPVIRILLEVNTSGEESKQGCTDESQLYRLIDDLLPMKQVEIGGLMTIGPFTREEARIRKAFVMLRDLFEQCCTRYSELRLTELSMGMSSDFELAIEEGSTLVRVGTALFGSRDHG